MYNLLKSDKKLLSYTSLKLKELAKSILRKISVAANRPSPRLLSLVPGEMNSAICCACLGCIKQRTVVIIGMHRELTLRQRAVVTQRKMSIRAWYQTLCGSGYSPKNSEVTAGKLKRCWLKNAVWFMCAIIVTATRVNECSIQLPRCRLRYWFE